VSVELVPVEGLPEVRSGDDLAAMLREPLRALGVRDGDVVAVTQKVVSKAEGRLASAADRDAVVAAETRRVVARRGDLLIAETAHGFVCANAGVDASNVDEGVLSLLPVDPDASAALLRSALTDALGVRLAVVITDTFGRPWREGVTNVAIGCAGIPSLVDLRGGRDHRDRELEVTVVALADEVAAATGLVMGKSSRGRVAIVRGVDPAGAPAGVARDLVRAPAADLFRESPLQALQARRDANAFGPGPVPREEIEDAVRDACAVPGPGGSSPWSFVALDSHAATRRFRAATTAALRTDLARDGLDPGEASERSIVSDGVLGAASTLIVPCVRLDGARVLPDADRRHAEQERILLSAGAAIERLVLALHARALAVAWTAAGLVSREASREALGLDRRWCALGTVAVGPMPEGGASRPRPAIDLAGHLRWA